jgi:chemotaxis protein histidine kinase CheA/DNA-binding response OmpR family regulator
MNSQDKPLEANDNFKESLETSEIIQHDDNKDLGDLWTEETGDLESVTEFISVETAAKNDSEALEEAVSDSNSEPVPKKQKNLDLDWDDLDFRNPPQVEDFDELESNIVADNYNESLASEIEGVENLELDDSAINDLGDLTALDSLTAESDPESSLEQINMDSLDDPAFNFDSNEGVENLELDDSAIDDLGDLTALDSLTAESDPESSLEQINMGSLDDPAFNFDSNEGVENLELDDSAIDDLEDLTALDSLTAESDSESSLEQINMGSLDDPAFNFDSNEGVENLELDGSIDELGDLESLDSLPEVGLDSLDNSDFDSLIDLDSDTESLDSLVLESTGDLEIAESPLESDLELLDLDSLLGDEPIRSSGSINQLESPKTQPVADSNYSSNSPDLSPVNKAQAFEQTMRVSVRKLDDLNNLIGELVVKRNRLEDDQERLRRFLDNLLGHVQSLGEAGAKMHDMYERSLLEGALLASRQSRANAAIAAGNSNAKNTIENQEEGLDALEMDRFTGFHLLSQDIIELIVRVREAASDIQFVVDETDKVAQTFRQVTSQLQDGMNSSRMVAFGQSADRLPRAIRDISRKQKKQTQLHIEGKDVLIDKMIVEHLYNPMTHLVNNAISHGIEKPEERLKKGKPEAGNVHIRAFIQGNQTVISVSDDGAGIDPEIVKQKAIEKNLISWATAQNLSEQQVYELLFHPGFSTKDQADDFAGRGVGMDVVNTDLKKIRGSISTESEIGKGTTFTIRLPLVLSICKALTCVDNNSSIAFPIDGVEDTKEYLPSDIQTNTNGVRCISWKNALLPLRPLSSLLNYNRQIRRAGIYNTNQNNDDTISVVVLRSLDNLLAVEVDEVRAEQEIVIKQIDGPIPKPPGIAGATVLGDGTIMPIGDVLELIEIAQGKRTIEIGFNILDDQRIVKQSQAESIQQEPMVLVVDDSITVRELLSMSFNKLGYRVEQARDGQEAWDKLRGGLACDMIFSDIEMPRMNGLELLSNLHKDSKLKSIPVAMLTSRGADKHKQIASDLGAKAYLTKPYTEKDLMDVAQHLIEINRANKEAESVTVNVSRIKNRQSEAAVSNAPLVLIIDDSVTVRELLSMTFKKAGYRVEQARDGQEAWEKLSDGLECDLAFCDIEMPRMNGLELLSQLQKDEKLASMPIAMLTSRGAQKMRNIAASRGANGYFVKPYVEDELLKAAERMIKGEMLIDRTEEEN